MASKLSFRARLAAIACILIFGALVTVALVDTSWAHMAGALGVPCWLLLPAERADWRWLPRAERTPWYDSLRLFWQQSPGDWSGPIGEVVARLESNRRAGAAVGA